MLGARADLEEPEPAGDGHRGQPVGGRAVTQLAFEIPSPAVGPPTRGERAAVIAARTDGSEAQPRRRRRGERRLGHWARGRLGVLPAAKGGCGERCVEKNS